MLIEGGLVGLDYEIRRVRGRNGVTSTSTSVS